ncbi:hypothetical protein SAM23877_2912 [Streptomyces ambofaciens ATCC 23877]|uniref:Uncharacterized protein n=1 Tax=Streptomyces ambofaciens (strain ATCC 23877 / 3486 / DSM 40053 / JCM 4204 / NBRC 12836 / NRRL B-2516) TaxID=278992 RepID=A0A0K2ASQ3_STRA7|nr:hypothetical protein SAM23877_2912 [Streptomyces ambofaciens ATCC 23877]
MWFPTLVSCHDGNVTTGPLP